MWRECEEKRKIAISDEAFQVAGFSPEEALVVEAVPGVILIGRESPLITARKPLMEVFDALGIEPNEVEALMRGGRRYMGRPIYKLLDSKGRVLIPKAMRDAAKMEYGDIVRLGLADGKVTVRKVEVVEAGDQSPEAMEAYVRAAFKSMPDSLRLELIGELSALLQKKEG